MRIVLLLLCLFLSSLSWAGLWPDNIVWKTGQVIAVSQRESEPATVLFEFMTGSRYGHVGLVVVEDGIPWVYEETHPHIQKVSLEDFFSKISTNGKGEKEFTLLKPSVEFNAEENSKLKAFLTDHLEKQTPYNYSGTKNPGRLNCAEFIHEAFNSAEQPPVGSYQEARELNINTLNGTFKQLWGRKNMLETTPIMTPFSIVTSPWLQVEYSNLPYNRVMSDSELFHGWVGTKSYKKFKLHFPALQTDIGQAENELSKVPKATYPSQCGILFL
jgi:hypothetical protein